MTRDEVLARMEAACGEMERLYTDAEARGLDAERCKQMALTVTTSATVFRASRAIVEELALPEAERRERGWDTTPEEIDAEVLPSLAADIDQNLEVVKDWYRK